MEATASCPTRAEALHGAACFCREKRIYERGYQFAKQGLAIPYPNKAQKSLFVQDWIYEYGLLDEFAVNAYWTERYQDCLEACQRLLRERKMPEDGYDRVKKNAEFAAQKIRNQSTISQPTAESSNERRSTKMRKADTNPAKSIVAAPIAEGAAEQPTAGAKTIGLCMIVKNETSVIRRCLESTLPLVDYILVVDTGSTDGTQQMIRDFLAEHKIKGAVIDEPWRDFAYNRSFALERLRQVDDVDYAMIIDADDTLELDAAFDPRAFKAQMTHDLYDVPVRHGSIAHHRPQLFSNRLPFSFKGVIHEYLEAPAGEPRTSNHQWICHSR